MWYQSDLVSVLEESFPQEAAKSETTYAVWAKMRSISCSDGLDLFSLKFWGKEGYVEVVAGY
jgi:hypothetical protein